MFIHIMYIYIFLYLSIYLSMYVSMYLYIHRGQQGEDLSVHFAGGQGTYPWLCTETMRKYAPAQLPHGNSHVQNTACVDHRGKGERTSTRTRAPYSCDLIENNLKFKIWMHWIHYKNAFILLVDIMLWSKFHCIISLKIESFFYKILRRAYPTPVLMHAYRTAASKRKWNTLKDSKILPDSQVKNLTLTLTVLYVPCSFDRGGGLTCRRA